MSAALYDFEELGRACTGIANFDGITWSRYLLDRCVLDMDIAPDGSVWLWATEVVHPTAIKEYAIETYVITPEAVAASK